LIPKLLETYEKLGIPLRERERLAGVAVDAVFDSVSVGTTFKKQLARRASSSARSARRCRSIPTW
jgi:Fe-S cluster assembly scaffold protein SufB